MGKREGEKNGNKLCDWKVVGKKKEGRTEEEERKEGESEVSEKVGGEGGMSGDTYILRSKEERFVKQGIII